MSLLSVKNKKDLVIELVQSILGSLGESMNKRFSIN